MSNSVTIIDDKFVLATEQTVTMSPITLATLIAEFLALGTFSPATRETYGSCLKVLWSFTDGDLSDAMLKRFKLKVIDEMEDRTSNKYLSATKRFLDYLVHRRIMQTNYFANSFTGAGKKIDKTDSPYVALSDSEVRSMIDFPDRSTRIGASQRLALVISFYLGIRVSELCGIRYRDIKGSEVKIKGKGNKVRTIPITEALLNEINAYVDLVATEVGTPAPERFLIETRESQGDAPHRNTILRWFTSIAKSVGIEKHFSPHSARATAITKALESGVGIRDVAILAGHSSVDTTSIYDKRRGEAAKKTVQAIKY